jgi:hypothetical protein
VVGSVRRRWNVGRGKRVLKDTVGQRLAQPGQYQLFRGQSMGCCGCDLEPWAWTSSPRGTV